MLKKNIFIFKILIIKFKYQNTKINYKILDFYFIIFLRFVK